MNLQRIKDLCDLRHYPLRRLAQDAGTTEATLHRCIRNGKIQAELLENIARTLGVSISTFFDAEIDTESKSSASELALLERIRLLELLVKEKERLIDVLMRK